MDIIDLKQQLIEIVPQSLKQGIQEVLDGQNIKTNAELILNLCKIITKKIDIYTVKAYSGWTKSYYTLYKGKSSIEEQEEQELMVYGTQLIYLLRTFINNDSINFHMASFDSNHKYKADAFVPQDQILQNLSVVNKKFVGVTQAIQKNLIDENKKNMQYKRQNLWERVEYLSEPLYIKGKNVSKINMKKSEKAHWAYQNQKKDFSIYLMWSGKRLEKYYDINGDKKLNSLQHFNNGWLWEWYNAILYGGSDEQYINVTNTLKKGSLAPIIQGKDFTPGTKQGDFRTLAGQQIQSKYGNEKIISFNNIRHIIYDLEIILTLFIQESNNINIQNNLLQILQEHFIPETVNIGARFSNQIADELIGKFKAPIK